MNIVLYKDARKNLKQVIKKTIDDADVTLIHRRKGGNAILISEAHYNSMIETLYLLSNHTTTEPLYQAIADVKAGNTTPYNFG